MSTAQAQADFLAATRTMTHAGPGGTGLTERLLAAGYPLAGDLSLGGFRAENITGGNEDMPPEAAVDTWAGDALHLNTMVSLDLTEIGAGVAIRDGRVYYVIDAARPVSAVDPPVVATSLAGGSPVPGVVPEMIMPVSVSTPNAEGRVVHEVKPGQTLWQIAVTYGTRIDQIKRLNNLFDNNIYPGSQLLIRTMAIVPASTPIAIATSIPTSTVLPPLTSSGPPSNPTLTASTAAQPPVVDPEGVMKVMLGIILFALVGGGMFAWLGSRKKG
jgi:hypothetical protein